MLQPRLGNLNVCSLGVADKPSFYKSQEKGIECETLQTSSPPCLCRADAPGWKRLRPFPVSLTPTFSIEDVVNGLARLLLSNVRWPRAARGVRANDCFFVRGYLVGSYLETG